MMDYAEMNREDAKAQLLYARDEGIAQGLRQGRNEESVHIARAVLLCHPPLKTYRPQCYSRFSSVSQLLETVVFVPTKQG
ncbi:MAG: hypothetical protein LBK67_12740, partial [Coriobacteriales bacterium]|nr:hypothetical protein [Coriobacteriales bacterium]